MILPSISSRADRLAAATARSAFRSAARWTRRLAALTVVAVGGGVAVAVAVAGCGGDGAPVVGGSEGDGGSGGDGGAPCVDPHTVPAELDVLDCTSAPAQMPAVCADGACAVTFDVEVTCEIPSGCGASCASAYEFPQTVHAAVTGPHVFFATPVAFSTGEVAATHLFSLDSGGAASEVPGFDLHATRVDLAVGDDDELIVVGDEPTCGDQSAQGARLVALLGDGSSALRRAVVSEADFQSLVYSFFEAAVAPDGEKLVWFASRTTQGTLDDYSLATVSEDLSIATKAAPFPANPLPEFDVATDGAELSFGFTLDAEFRPLQLEVLDGAQTSALGDPMRDVLDANGEEPVASFATPRPPTGAGGETVRYAAVIEDAVGLRVAHASGAGYDEGDVPEGGRHLATCGPAQGTTQATCPDSVCRETGDGAEGFGAARVPGDVVVAAFVLAHHDDAITQRWSCDVDGTCGCSHLTDTTGTTRELVVVRFPMTGGAAPTVVARAPLDSMTGAEVTSFAPVSVASHGADVVVTLAESVASGDAPRLRVLRIATEAP
jgi:hypothetical protein